MDLLTPYTRDAWALTSAGTLGRLRLLAAEPPLARSRDEHDTVLFYLPDDECMAAGDCAALCSPTAQTHR